MDGAAHPAAMLALVAYHADVGRTIAYALLVGCRPPRWPADLRHMDRATVQLPAENPIAAQFTAARAARTAFPRHTGFGISLFTVLLQSS